jgi:hypothetical protein
MKRSRAAATMPDRFACRGRRIAAAPFRVRFENRLHDDLASPHREEPPHGGVSNGETHLSALLRMRKVVDGTNKFTSS